MKFTIDDKSWLTLADGKELYDLSYNSFKKLAAEANALTYWGNGKRIARVNREVFESYFKRLL